MDVRDCKCLHHTFRGHEVDPYESFKVITCRGRITKKVSIKRAYHQRLGIQQCITSSGPFETRGDDD